MKYLTAFILLLSTCPPTPAQTSNISENYSTMWLMQWLHDCSTALAPSYQMRGMPEHFAMQKSVYDCACVIDKFRTNFSQAEADRMAVEDRQLFSERYTQECLGIITDT